MPSRSRGRRRWRLEERRGDRRLGGLGRLVAPARVADAEQRGARAPDDGAHVGEVEVDQARQGDQVADALHALAQQVVADLEGLDHAGAALEDRHQAVVGDDDHRVGGRLQGLEPLARPRCAAALEAEGPGHHGDRQRAHLARDLRDQRGAAGAGAAALARGDEHQVAAAQRAAHLLALAHGLLAQVWVAAGAEAAGDLHPDRDADVGLAASSAWRSVLTATNSTPAQAGLDHAVDRRCSPRRRRRPRG